MSERKWTPQQKHSIEATDGTVLVSAAAGSGKTAVLVERVIRMITRAQDPVPVDRLLIVTFTRAAAAEMRQRLGEALAKKAAEDPENPVYQRQQMLLPQAQISTIHGFCAALLREQAGRAGLPPRFRVAEESETLLLGNEALDTVLEESYSAKDPAFVQLAAQLSEGRNDKGLREAVRQAYIFMQAQPVPEDWLQQQLDAYTAVVPLEKTVWMQHIRQELTLSLEGCVAMADRTLQLCAREELEKYRPALLLDREALASLQAICQNEATAYDDMHRAVHAITMEKLPTLRGIKGSAAEQNQTWIKELRTKIKDEIGRAQGMLCGTEAQCREDLEAMAPLVEALGRLVLRYRECYTALKRQKKLLDYDDLEHECLKLLLDPATNGPTPLALELSERYHQIMVDEYQDTNAAQDTLFRVLSRHEENLFMVGDVKQSIYGFRQAMPTIFTKRRDAYRPYDEKAPVYPATITLGHNFRSRRHVTDGVNFLFRQVMQESLGEVAYGEREELVCAADYAAAEGCETEWLLLDSQRATEEMPATDLAEIGAIARRIRELMDTMTVKSGDGTRPLAYGDICILLRGHAKAALFSRELNKLGIPAGADSSDSFLTTPEVMTALSLLRVIDNPLREVELTAVMLSPLYGMTPDDVATVRLTGGRYTPLYTALQMQADSGEGPAPLCRRLLEDLRRARTLAVAMPADRLLERLYRDTGLTAVFSARAGGRQRVANLHQLDQLARSYEQGEFRGLSAFIRHIDRLQEQDKDLPGGNAVRGDSVRIMTVHHSKGLEFPVVFLAHLHGPGSNQDDRSRLLFHHKAGIGLRLRNMDTMEKHDTLPFLGVRAARRQNDRAEELRVWYVALTRAREKLIMVACYSDLGAKLERLEMRLTDGPTLLPATLLRTQAPADWLLMAALRHPSFAPLRQNVAPVDSLPAQEPFALRLPDPSLLPEDATAATADTAQPDEDLCRILRPRFAYRYPYEALAAVPAKVAASALSHQALSREHIATQRPAFLQKNGLTAAQKGTALHTFMQFADYTAAAADPTAEAARLVRDGFMTAAQAAVLPTDKLMGFFGSSLYARMAASPDCRREFHFTVNVPAATVAPHVETTEETVVVQGIADCVFREGDGLTLLDYKTDRVKTPEELAQRYRSQLTFYKRALEPILGLPVTQAVLYSFHLEQEITVSI